MFSVHFFHAQPKLAREQTLEDFIQEGKTNTKRARKKSPKTPLAADPELAHSPEPANMAAKSRSSSGAAMAAAAAARRARALWRRPGPVKKKNSRKCERGEHPECEMGTARCGECCAVSSSSSLRHPSFYRRSTDHTLTRRCASLSVFSAPPPTSTVRSCVRAWPCRSD